MGELHHVVIVGGGFGGLYAAQALRGAGVRVTLLDKHNHHTFQPLLYQVATAGLNPSDIAGPIRHVLRKQRHALVLLGEVVAIDPRRKTVRYRKNDLEGSTVGPPVELAYDSLILAAGATHSYFGHDDWARFAPGLKTLVDALEMRRRIFFAFEAAEREDDPAVRAALLTFAVVGGGPTGVELAGALADIARTSLVGDFRRIDPATARVVLLEAGPEILPTYVAKLRAKAVQQLTNLGVEVRRGAPVTGIDEKGVDVGKERLEARTVLWAAGVLASPLARTLGVPLDKAGRVLVEPDLSVPGYPDVYVVGDLAHVQQDGALVPGVARAAIDGARHTARNIRRTLRGEARLPFHYDDRGSLATIGRAAAVADFGRIKLSGFLAWASWLLIHILFLIGFRSRVVVLFEWIWGYFTFERGARLITSDAREAPELDAARPAPKPRRRQGERRGSQPRERSAMNRGLEAQAGDSCSSRTSRSRWALR